jgi:hypothetical protein
MATIATAAVDRKGVNSDGAGPHYLVWPSSIGQAQESNDFLSTVFILFHFIRAGTIPCGDHESCQCSSTC